MTDQDVLITLYNFAMEQSDNVLYQLLTAQRYYPKDLNDFLCDTIMYLSETNKQTRQQLVDKISRRLPPTIKILTK